jgi:thiamine-phosphate pyrophosphorylase
VACHTREDVLRAESENADFALFAPVFEKVRTAAAGLAALGEACQVRIPVLALGGVALENAVSCLEAGAAGIAAIRLFQENRIEDVVRALRNNDNRAFPGA